MPNRMQAFSFQELPAPFGCFDHRVGLTSRTTGLEKKGEPLDFDPQKSVIEWLRAGTLMEGVLTNSLAAEELGPVQMLC